MAYSEENIKEFKEKILYKISFENKSLNTILTENKEFPSHDTVYRWLNEDKEFSENYARARDIRADKIFDEMIEIADDMIGYISDDYGNRKLDNGHVQKQRLQIDTRKWILSRMNPKKYSDKLDVTTNGNDITKKERPKIIFKNIEKDNE